MSGPKPLRKIKINAAPTLRAIDEAPASFLGSLAEVEIARRAADLLADAALIARLLAAYEDCKVEYEASPHVEQRIYDGFALPADEQLMARFHQEPWSERHALVPQFTDERFAFLAARIIYAEHPDHLPDHLRQEIHSHIGERVTFNGKCDWGTIPSALAECEQLFGKATAKHAAMLTTYREHLAERLAAFGSS